MEFEKEYISYLIENVKDMNCNLLDSYFRNQIEFGELLEKLDVTEYNVLSYKKYLKSKKIDDLLN